MRSCSASRIGPVRIGVGLEADLIVLVPDPLADFRVVYEPLGVVNNGEVVLNRYFVVLALLLNIASPPLALSPEVMTRRSGVCRRQSWRLVWRTVRWTARRISKGYAKKKPRKMPAF